MKKVMKTVVLFCLLTLILLATVSCSNIFGDLLGGNEESTTPETTTQPHAHTFGEWVTTQNATCTEKGQQERVCSCGEKELQEIDALGHNETADAAVSPTCTADGLTAGSHCSVCGEIFLVQEVIPATHDWMQLALLESATCFTYGEERRSCRVCGVIENAPVEPLEHNFVLDGESQYHTCTLCNGILFKGHIYTAIGGEHHWFDAYEFCEEMGGHLVTITSEEEQAVIDYLMSLELHPILGYYCGGVRLSGDFHWITGEDFEYQNWDPEQPNFYKANQYFILIYNGIRLSASGQSGCWDDAYYQLKAGFLCEWELEISNCEHTFTEWKVTTEPTCWNEGEQYRFCNYCGAEETEVLPKLEHNFALNEENGIEMCEHCNAAKYDGHIYALFTEQVDWFEAYSRCEALGGHLATNTSQAEHEFIAKYTQGNTIWLGAYCKDDQWCWITGEAFEYTNWFPSEPNNSGGKEYAMGMNYSSKAGTLWVDVSMANLYAYLCEFECEE